MIRLKLKPISTLSSLMSLNMTYIVPLLHTVECVANVVPTRLSSDRRRPKEKARSKKKSKKRERKLRNVCYGSGRRNAT